MYSYIFETPPPSDTKVMRKYRTAPHPFLISICLLKRGGDINPEKRDTLRAYPDRRAIHHLPYFIYTFDELGKIGIGKGKAKYELRKVTNNGKTIYDSSSKTLKTFNPVLVSLTVPTLEKSISNYPTLENGG